MACACLPLLKEPVDGGQHQQKPFKYLERAIEQLISLPYLTSLSKWKCREESPPDNLATIVHPIERA
jgi:hypothetical protein